MCPTDVLLPKCDGSVKSQISLFSVIPARTKCGINCDRDLVISNTSGCRIKSGMTGEGLFTALSKCMQLGEIGGSCSIDITSVIGHTLLKRGRLDAGRLSICGPATSWDTCCGGTQFGDFLFSTLKREFLSSHQPATTAERGLWPCRKNNIFTQAQRKSKTGIWAHLACAKPEKFGSEWSDDPLVDPQYPDSPFGVMFSEACRAKKKA
jgi:hypothetical protein